MGYQHVENYKHDRRLLIREYEETDELRLPDERFQIEMRYMDAKQIQAEKVAYSAQMAEFRREIMRLWDVVDRVYYEEKARNNTQDWEDLMGATIYRNQPSGKKGWFQGSGNGQPGEEEESNERVWNEITFVQRELTTLEEMNQTYEMQVEENSERLKKVRTRLKEIFGLKFPDHRVVIEERLNFLEDRFNAFTHKINPYHMQPGLLLDVDVRSISRRKVTIKGMANVLNEFLSGVSRGFVDASMSHFTKRRSHVGGVDDSFGGH